MLNKTLTACAALAMAFTLAAAPALAQGKSQADKKPAQSCEGMDKATKAYSDCVKAQAMTTKDTRQADPKTNQGKKPAK